MFVKAKAVGYDGSAVRYPGDVFEMPDGSKGSWFDPVEADAPSSPRRKLTKEEQAAIEAEKRASMEAAMAPPPMTDYDPVEAKG